MDNPVKVSAATGPTVEAILRAFRELFLERGFADVRVIDIVERAGIGRSTFYEYFQSREDVLRESVRAPLQHLANLARSRGDDRLVALMLSHFRTNAPFALGLLKGPAAAVIHDALADLTELAPILAHAVAGAQLAVICVWLNETYCCSADELSISLRRITLALCLPQQL
jgi:AcrR family transcriptional regulator